MGKIDLIYQYKLKPHTDKVVGLVKALFRKKGLNLLGYFDTPIGIAEVGRQCFLDLDRFSSFPSCILNFPLSSHSTQGYIKQAPYAGKLSSKVKYDTNILFFNADYIARYIHDHLQSAQGTRTIGVFWWELEDYFYFKEGVDAVDEIFVFSDFVKQAILKSFPHKRISKFSFPYTLPSMNLLPAAQERLRYGILPDDFVVFFNFDFFSGYERKNPEGLVNAFSLAFRGNSKAKLLLKTIHAGSDNENYAQLIYLIEFLGIQSQVVFVDKNLSKDALMSLLNSADIYVSLHRSEGLGIGMMEAMLLGKPVVATGYGGNMEFTKPDTSLLVDYKIVEIQKDTGPYLKGYKWAEPEVNDAANKMKVLYEQPETRKQYSKKALENIEKYHQNGRFSRELDEWMKGR